MEGLKMKIVLDEFELLNDDYDDDDDNDEDEDE